jgi:predicted metal-binding protein
MSADLLQRRARILGIQVCRELDPRLLRPEETIRALCLEDKCGNYGKHHMCPPLVGSLDDARSRLGGHSRGVLLQWTRQLDVRGDHRGVERSRVDFHLKILDLESELCAAGEARAPWGLIGGSCALCGRERCRAASGEPCEDPDRARTSLEALGVDVLCLLAGFGLDNSFHPDRITWTGCVLF